MSKLPLHASVRESWGEWIAGQHWDLFVTLTSEKQTHPEAMLKRFRYCMNKASDHVYGRHWDRRGMGVQWVVGLERTKRGWPHSHAICRFPMVDIAGPEGREMFDLGYWSKWMSSTGGFAWLELPHSKQAVINYVCKYVVKDGDLELSPNVEFAAPSGSQLVLLDRRPRGTSRHPEAAVTPAPWDDPDVDAMYL